MQRFHHVQHPLALVVVGVLLAGCLNAAGASGLEQTDWRLAQYRSDAGLVDATQDAPVAMLRFEGGDISGSAGCNRLMGSYTLDGDKLSIGPNLASTMMACPPPLMAQEQAVTKALTQAMTYALGDKMLTLVDADGEPLLTFTAMEAPPLVGTVWRLTRYNNGKGGVTTVLRDTEVTLMLGAGGELRGKACNNYRGGYTADAGAFRLQGPIAATKMLCPGPEGANAQEAAYFAALARAAAYDIRGDTLTLKDADGSTLAVFRAEQPAH